METVTKFQDLWRLRRYVAGVCVVALLAGMLVTYQGKSYDVATATAQVLVDTPRSQVVGASSANSSQGGVLLGTLATQANLLADLMVEGPIKADIAHRAGLTPNQLTGVSAAVTVPVGSGSASGPSSVSVPSGPNVFALSTQILTDSGGQTTLPIIQIEAYAPSPDKAARLASAAVAGVQAFVSSQAENERISDADRLSIMSLGVSQATTQTDGSSTLIGIVVALVVLLLGCASILWIQAVIRAWRSASERERLGEPLEDEAEWELYELDSPVAPARSRTVSANGAAQRDIPTNGVSDKSIGVSGKSTRVSGKSTRVSGKSTRVSGKSTRVSGKSTRVSGNSKGVSGNSKGVSGNSKGVSGNSKGVSGNSKGVSGNSKGVSGNSKRVSGKSKHGGTGPGRLPYGISTARAADNPSLASGDTAGQEPASSPHQRSSVRLLTGSRGELFERKRKLTPRLEGSVGRGSAERHGQSVDEEGPRPPRARSARSNGDDA